MTTISEPLTADRRVCGKQTHGTSVGRASGPIPRPTAAAGQSMTDG